jgi:hypothetical protein
VSIHHAVNVAGQVVGAVSTAGAGTLWLAAQVQPAMPPSVAENAGLATILGILSSLAVLVINGWLADRKGRRDLEVRKLESTERIAALEGQVDDLRTDARIELILRQREAEALIKAKAHADALGAGRDAALERLTTAAASPSPLPDHDRWADDGGPHPEAH